MRLTTYLDESWTHYLCLRLTTHLDESWTHYLCLRLTTHLDEPWTHYLCLTLTTHLDESWTHYLCLRLTTHLDESWTHYLCLGLTTHLDESWTHYLSLRLTILDKEMTKNALVVELVTFWLEHIKILSYKDLCVFLYCKSSFNSWFGFMVFNTTFNNISVISWRSVILLEETGKTRKKPHMITATTAPSFNGKHYWFINIPNVLKWLRVNPC
jgi:hypothetical protein